MNEAQEVLRSLSEHLAGSASVKQVFGEPIHTAGKTIVPVARVRYMVGGGGGGGEQMKATVDRPLAGGGGGGGGAVMASPMGALEISETGTRFIRFFDRVEIAKLCLGGVALLLLASGLVRRRR
jgi:uncharacterized spore protein YtfJ